MRRALVVLGIVLGFVGDARAQSCASTQGQLEICKSLTNAVRFGFPRYPTASLPTCNTNNKGAVAFDTTATAVKYCDGSAYVTFASSGGGTPPFSSITGATNTSAAMLVGTGASLGFTGTGTIAASSTNIIIANEGVTGTTANYLAKLTGAPSTAVLAATTDTQGIVGIVVSGAGTTGSATIARSGSASCAFDGATTAGDYVIVSTTAAGKCHDTGAATYPTGAVQVLGRVLSTNVGAGTYAMTLHMGTQGTAAGSVGVGTTTVTGGTTTRVLYDNAGTLGEYGVSGSGNVAMTTSPALTTPTVTTSQVLTNDNLVTTPAGGITVQNTTAATNGVQVQDSPPFVMCGTGWDTSPGVTNTNCTRMYAQPTSGGTTTVSTFWDYQINGGSWNAAMFLTNNALQVGGSITAGSGITAGSTGAINWSSRSRMTSSANGVWSVGDNGGTNVVTVHATGAPAVAGSCGTSPSVAGQDTALEITTGTGSPTSCTVTFQAAWATAPVCVANAQTTTTALNVATTTTTVTVSSVALTASEKIYVTCFGY